MTIVKGNIEENNFIMLPKNDFAFKLIFGDSKNIDVLQALLSAILNVPIEELNELTIINNELLREFKEDKKGILDVRAKTRNGKEINIEIQVLPTKYMSERTAYYWSKMYNGQIKSGDTYDKLNKCITINIVDFECTPLKKIHTSYHITEDETGYRLTEVLEIHYVELSKLKKEGIEKNENEATIQWAEFIGSDSREVMELLATKNSDIGKAYDILTIMSKDENARMAYEAREAEIHDQATREKTAREEGIDIGREIGREEGIDIGKTKGEFEKAIKLAENFLRMGFSVEEVAKGSELPIENIIEIQNKITN